MVSSTLFKKNIPFLEKWIILSLLPLLSACSSNQKKVLEIITPPKLPSEFSSIPDQTTNPQLQELLSAKEIKNITIGRKDPFLPPQLEGNKLFAPPSFKYHGQISSVDVLNAFVSYQNRRGIIKPGDIGGEHTDLLPKGWTLLSLDTDTKVLTLSFEDRLVDVELFPKK